MRSQNWFTPAENELSDEAIRLLPAIALARINDDQDGVTQLFRGYRERAAELGVSTPRMWQIFGTAGVSWEVTHIRYVAGVQDCSPEQAAQGIIAKALDWTVNDA